jgi:hypothetical protein
MIHRPPPLHRVGVGQFSIIELAQFPEDPSAHTATRVGWLHFGCTSFDPNAGSSPSATAKKKPFRIADVAHLGGQVLAAQRTPEQRSASARKAALARHKQSIKTERSEAMRLCCDDAVGQGEGGQEEGHEAMTTTWPAL